LYGFSSGIGLAGPSYNDIRGDAHLKEPDSEIEEPARGLCEGFEELLIVVGVEYGDIETPKRGRRNGLIGVSRTV
jgi:hypothetical protein